LVYIPTCFQAKYTKDKHEHVCVLLQFIAKRSDHLYELFMNHLKYWHLISTRGSHKPVFLTWLFIYKFEFNVQWRLHFNKKYFTCIPFYLGGMVFNHIYRSYILLYAEPTYSYMPVLHTLLCRSYILLYAGPTYSFMPVLYILIFQSIILLHASSLYSYGVKPQIYFY
jgi:hypothetical protein